MEAAAESGLAVAIYNPVRKGLPEKLDEVRKIFDGRRAILTRDAGRQGESSVEKPVRDIAPEDLDMRTVIFVLSPKARAWNADGGKKWIEARGYGSEVETRREPRILGQFLVLGGAAEGRDVASRLLERGYSVTVSVTRDAGALTVPKGANVLLGARDAAAWGKLLSGRDAREGLLGVIDATHPFAVAASREIASACEGAGVPLRRFVRASGVQEDAVMASDLGHAIDRSIQLTSEGDVIFLALGANDLASALPRVRKAGRGVLARMLPTVQSVRQAERAGLSPREIIAAWGAGGVDFNAALCGDRNVKCIVSRDSGSYGHVAEKAEAARRLGIPLVLIARPPEPERVIKLDDFDGLLEWCGELAAASGVK
jgi:precorrin-6x reductase